jgi:hypothetical protein
VLCHIMTALSIPASRSLGAVPYLTPFLPLPLALSLSLSLNRCLSLSLSRFLLQIISSSSIPFSYLPPLSLAPRLSQVREEIVRQGGLEQIRREQQVGSPGCGRTTAARSGMPSGRDARMYALCSDVSRVLAGNHK